MLWMCTLHMHTHTHRENDYYPLFILNQFHFQQFFLSFSFANDNFVWINFEFKCGNQNLTCTVRLAQFQFNHGFTVKLPDFFSLNRANGDRYEHHYSFGFFFFLLLILVWNIKIHFGQKLMLCFFFVISCDNKNVQRHANDTYRRFVLFIAISSHELFNWFIQFRAYFKSIWAIICSAHFSLTSC